MKILLLLFLSCLLSAQERPKIVNVEQKGSPPNVTFEDKYLLQTMRVRAYEILSDLKDARVRRHQAAADEQALQGKFDLQNVKIELEVARLAVKYKAEGWEFGPDYTWVKKKEGKK